MFGFMAFRALSSFGRGRPAPKQNFGPPTAGTAGAVLGFILILLFTFLAGIGMHSNGPRVGVLVVAFFVFLFGPVFFLIGAAAKSSKKSKKQKDHAEAMLAAYKHEKARQMLHDVSRKLEYMKEDLQEDLLKAARERGGNFNGMR